MPDASERISFAHNARTLCIAFVAFASRYYQGNLTTQDLQRVFRYTRTENATASEMYDIFSNIDGVQHLLPPAVFAQKDKYDNILDQLFNTIINAGVLNFSIEAAHDSTLTATNYLKNDKNYYKILSFQWATISAEINRILSLVM